MRAFAVADHGIRSHGGHNLTYARRVLAAAAAAGWRPVLGVHVEAEAGLGAGTDTSPVFRRDMGGLSPSTGRLWRTPALGRTLLGKVRAPGFGSFAAPPSATEPATSAPATRGPLLRRLLEAAWAPGDDVSAHYGTWRGPDRYGDDLCRFIEAARLERGDVVLLPTIGPRELLGLASLLRRSAAARALAWRVVLRYPPNARTDEKVLRLALRRLEDGGADVGLFTDTRPLASAYGMLLGWAPAVLPIPVEPDFARRERPDGGLTVGYFGDARSEKGFCLLPDLVRRVRALKPTGPAIRFIVQTNFSIADGETAAASALTDLEGLADEHLTLIDGPFDPDGYRRNFHAADVVLIPYDPAAYDARSSGVFMEAIAAGTPALVSAGSWMADVLKTVQGPAASLVVERTVQGFAEGICQVDRNRPAFERAAELLRVTMHPLYDPARLVSMVAASSPGR